MQSTFQGEALVFRQLFRALPLLLIGAIFVMYVILGILYESYVHPITVLFPAIVPAVVGGLSRLDFWIDLVALQRDRTLSVARHREKERNHGGRFRFATNR